MTNEQTIAGLEREWVRAAMANDVAAVDRIIADDWVGVAYNGQRMTKADVLRDMRSGPATTTRIELGDIEVRVYSTTAVVNVTSTETSTWQGKDTSGRYVLVDVYVNRGQGWQVVSSQATKVQ